jgi:ankyrin repeat protein
LQEINKADWEFACHLLQCVAVASRPLRVEELAEFLAFDFKEGPIPEFHEGWRLEDSVDAVLSTCSSLLAVVNVEGSLVVQFSHFSVKEFLTSTRLAESSDVIVRRHHISMTPAHTLMARACLGILLHLDGNVTRDDLEKFPLAGYAAKHWIDHVRFENVSQHVEDGMKHLFDPGKPHLAVCVWIQHPTSRKYIQPERPPFPCRGKPLHYAAIWGLHAIIEFLVIEHSQDVHPRAFLDKVTPLHLSSRWGHVEAVRMLVKLGADVTAQNKYGSTPLHLAKHVDVARMLVERGAKVAAQSSLGWTPLHLVSRRGLVEVARLFLDHGADVKAREEDGSTPLHLASLKGHAELVSMFLDRGADESVRDKDGSTSLHLASRCGRVEVTRVLLARGADVDAQEENGLTPLHLASLRGHADVACMLVERSANVSAQNKLGSTPLLLASRSGHVEVTRILLECGADLTVRDKDGSTALHLALQLGRAAVACILLEHGADATAQDRDALTPLHLASRGGHVEVVRMLLERGADAKAQDKHGSTPLHLASRGGYEKVARILLEHGADAEA